VKGGERTEEGGRRVGELRWRIFDGREYPFRLLSVQWERWMRRWGRLMNCRSEGRVVGDRRRVEDLASDEGRRAESVMLGRVVGDRGRLKRVARGTFGEGKGGFPSREGE
jgi:hypothetical protein